MLTSQGENKASQSALCRAAAASSGCEGVGHGHDSLYGDIVGASPRDQSGLRREEEEEHEKMTAADDEGGTTHTYTYTHTHALSYGHKEHGRCACTCTGIMDVGK